MKKRNTQTVISLALSAVFLLALSSSRDIRAANVRLDARDDNNLNLRTNLELKDLNLNNLRAARLNSNNDSLNRLRRENSPAVRLDFNDLSPNDADSNRSLSALLRNRELI